MAFKEIILTGLLLFGALALSQQRAQPNTTNVEAKQQVSGCGCRDLDY